MKHLPLQLKQLETVWHAVATGYNLSQAAERLHTSQSSLSKHISLLEHQLGSPVFTRQGKRLTGLSELGQKLLPHIESIIAESRTIDCIAHDYTRPDTGTLTVATTHTQARYVLPKIVQKFRERFEKVKLVLIQADPKTCARMVADGRADIAIATEALLDSTVLHCHRFYDWRHVVIAPKEHAIVQEKMDLATLASYPLVTYHEGFTGRGAIDHAFFTAGFVPQIVLAALDADVISTYVQSGLGVGIIAQMAFEPSHYPNLHAQDIDYFGKFTTWIAHRDDLPLRGFGQSFIQSCQQHFH